MPEHTADTIIIIDNPSTDDTCTLYPEMRKKLLAWFRKTGGNVVVLRYSAEDHS